MFVSAITIYAGCRDKINVPKYVLLYGQLTREPGHSTFGYKRYEVIAEKNGFWKVKLVPYEKPFIIGVPENEWINPKTLNGGYEVVH